MNINFTAELADFVAAEIATGDYVSSSEFVRDALRSMRRDREMEQQKLVALRYEVGLGLAEAERGEFSSRTIDDILQQVLREQAP